MKPTVWIEKVRARRGRRVTSYRVRWKVGGRLAGSENCGPNRSHAEQRRTKIEEALWAGKLHIRQPDAGKTWADLWARYERDHRREVSDRTWSEFYESAQRELKALYGADLPLLVFDVDKAQALLDRLGTPKPEGRGLAPNTVSMRMRFLSAIVSYAVRPLKWMTENPILDVKVPKYRRGGRVIQPAELELIVQHAPARARAPLWLLPQTGMRPGELINLQQQQLDRARGYVRVMRHAELGIGTDWQRKTLAEVHVPIRADLWPLFGPAAKAGWVFPGYAADPRERGNQLAKDCRKACRAAERAAGLAPDSLRITPHHSKHTYCTAFLEAGGNIQDLSKITGTRAETLLRVYRHIVSRAPLSETARVNFGALPAPAQPQHPPLGARLATSLRAASRREKA